MGTNFWTVTGSKTGLIAVAESRGAAVIMADQFARASDVAGGEMPLAHCGAWTRVVDGAYYVQIEGPRECITIEEMRPEGFSAAAWETLCDAERAEPVRAAREAEEAAE
jgi:hypothetical protein